MEPLKIGTWWERGELALVLGVSHAEGGLLLGTHTEAFRDGPARRLGLQTLEMGGNGQGCARAPRLGPGRARGTHHSAVLTVVHIQRPPNGKVSPLSRLSEDALRPHRARPGAAACLHSDYFPHRNAALREGVPDRAAGCHAFARM